MSCSWGEFPASAYDDFDATEKQEDFDIVAEAPDIPGHESGCPWAVRRVCVCPLIFQVRRESFNEGWKDGYEEGFDEGFSQGKRFGAL